MTWEMDAFGKSGARLRRKGWKWMEMNGDEGDGGRWQILDGSGGAVQSSQV
jgi:hypothetical protein